MKTPEILSPGGDAKSVKAAIAAGADAIYLGLQKFNARKRAQNISEKELSELIRLAKSYKVKIFITMNVLILESEIEEAVNCALNLYNLGVDGIIIQDSGLAYLLNKLIPELEIHASTQMTTHNILQIDYLEKLGFSQINFSRELSLNEIKDMSNYCHSKSILSEVFVHGAYCISCSGVCFFSTATTGESANRGSCVQLCRRYYKTKDNKSKNLLDLKDNNAIDFAADISKAGADVLKIEGRIKGFNYVYTVTKTWRDQIDNLSSDNSYSNTDLSKEQLNKVFNRGFSTGYLENNISNKMYNKHAFDQSLVYCGKVVSYTADKKELTIDREIEIRNGTKLTVFGKKRKFIATLETVKYQKNNSYIIKIENRLMGKITQNQEIYISGNSNILENIEKEIEKLTISKKSIDILVSGKLNEKLVATFITGDKERKVKSQSTLTKSQNNGLCFDSLQKQFSRLGATDFQLRNLSVINLEPNLFLPIKELNSLRREAISYFTSEQKQINFTVRKNTKKFKNKLALLFSSKEDYLQLENKNYLAFLEVTATSKIEDFSEGLLPWIPMFIPQNKFEIYTSLISSIKPNLIVTDNSGIGAWCQKNRIEWIAGPELNCSNSYSFRAYKKNGAVGGFYSTELSRMQINDFSSDDSFMTFCKVFGAQLMMTSRNCFFLNSSGCIQGKEYIDDKCSSCKNNESFKDEHNHLFHIEKKSGYINRIFDDKVLFALKEILKSNSDYYLLDFRKFQFTKSDNKDNQEIINFCTTLIENRTLNQKRLNSIKTKFHSTSTGSFETGI